jgi:hypothetical protein
MAKSKEVVQNKVKHDDKDKKIYIILAGTDGAEEEITLVFKSDGDADKAKRVDKLGLEGLPTSGAGLTAIQWVNNFWLKNDKDGYVNDVSYYLQLSNKPGKTFVYFNGASVVKPAANAIKSMPNDMIQVEISGGDPAAGWG